MQIDSSDKAQAKPAGADGEKASTADGDKEGSAEGSAEGQKAKAPKEPEPSSHSLDNPARVVPAQEKLVKFPEGSRYMPIRSGRTAGILLLKDSTPGRHSYSLPPTHPCQRLIVTCTGNRSQPRALHALPVSVLEQLPTASAASVSLSLC